MNAQLSQAQLIVHVWQKGHIVAGYDAGKWRKDDFGNWIRWQDYGNRDSEFGWEIDHIVPVSEGGTDDFSNLRPLWWKTNVKRN